MIVLIVLFLAAGIIFSVLPPLPGPLLSLGGLLLMHFTVLDVPGWILFTSVTLALLVTVVDYILPVAATKRFGGTKSGVWGGIIGTLLAVIFPIFGAFTIILGPLVGAIIGDLIGGNRFKAALKSGFGSFIGFMLATSVKVGYSLLVGVFVIARIGARLINQLAEFF